MDSDARTGSDDYESLVKNTQRHSAVLLHSSGVFDRYSIRVEEQTRDALRRATDYTTKQRQKTRTVVPLAERRAG